MQHNQDGQDIEYTQGIVTCSTSDVVNDCIFNTECKLSHMCFF